MWRSTSPRWSAWRRVSAPCAFVDEYQLSDGRRLYLLGEGWLINLAAAEGYPAAVMDMSFTNQALSVEYIVQRKGELPREVFAVPAEIDAQVARLKLQALGVEIDALTDEQAKYLDSHGRRAHSGLVA